MSIKSTFAIACTIAGLSCTSASAVTYDAVSHLENNAREHSLWFAGSEGGGTPNGATGPKANHFLFENSTAGVGTFQLNESDDPTTATLSGTVRNAAGQGFRLMLSLIEVAVPTNFKITPGAVTTDWQYFDLDATGANVLESLTDGIASFDITLRGTGLAAQLGTGANDKNANLLGFSTWITLSETGCQGAQCERQTGDFNILLNNERPNPSVVPLPAGLPLIIGGLGMLGLVGRRRKA